MAFKLVVLSLLVTVVFGNTISRRVSDECRDPPQSGNCGNEAVSQDSWYFDFRHGDCLPFIWSRCPNQSQRNVFPNKENCMAACRNA